MKYIDRVYGQAIIDEPVILDLLALPEMQRLKGVDQAGYFTPYYPLAKHSRFEHSVGVYLLLRQHGASIREQIAGLLHDISHSVFSHCIDYVFAEGSEEKHSHQDNAFDGYVRKSGVPDVLDKHGYDLDYILDDTNFPLKEKDIPDLCADRIDYSIRTAIVFDQRPAEEIRSLLRELKAVDGQWVFDSLSAAQRFASLFERMNRIYYSNIESALMFRTVGDVLKHALRQGYIVQSDLYTTDDEVLLKVIAYSEKDERLQYLLRRMNNEIPATNDEEEYEVKVLCKSRIVDPFFRNADGNARRVSDFDPQWGELVKRELKPKEYYIRFLK